MIPHRNWDGSNPLYDKLWTVNSERNRLRRELFDLLLSSLPDQTATSLIDEILNADHLAELRYVSVKKIVDPLIDKMLDHLSKKAIVIRDHFKLGDSAVDVRVIVLSSFGHLEDTTEGKLKWMEFQK
jgi:hypothetical protein